MMVLKHPNIEKEIEFSECIFYYISIENSFMYRNTIFQLLSGTDSIDAFHLYDNAIELNATKSIYFIDNPSFITFDEKKLNLTIQKEVAGEISVSENETYLEMINKINDYLSSITYDFPLRLKFDDEMSLLTFLKAFSVGYGGDNEDFLITIIEKIKILVDVFKFKVIILHNLCDYLSKKEFEYFISEMRHQEIFFLIISSHIPAYKTDEEFIIRIDSDLCELHIEEKSKKC